MYAVIHPIEPFDASKGTIINFTWKGNQIRQVHCIIKKNETGETVYDMTDTNQMKQEFNMIDTSKPDLSPTSKLVNGEYYIAYITVIDSDGVESETQAIGTPFYCFSEPDFKLSLNDSDIVRASTYEINVSYAQSENEDLNTYNIKLYNYNMQLLQDSGEIASDVNSMKYVISKLENGKEYYVRATGKTVHGMEIDTGFILFSVQYIQAQVFSPLEVNNMADIGAIEVKSNIISTNATSEKDVEYIDGDKIDLRNNSITYDIGFEVAGDHSDIYLFEKPNLNTSIVHFTGEKTSADVIYREGSYSNSDGYKSYFELQVETGGRIYTIYSNYVKVPTDNQQFSLLVTRESNLYNIKVVLVDKKEVIE